MFLLAQTFQWYCFLWSCQWCLQGLDDLTSCLVSWCTLTWPTSTMVWNLIYVPCSQACHGKSRKLVPVTGEKAFTCSRVTVWEHRGAGHPLPADPRLSPLGRAGGSWKSRRCPPPPHALLDFKRGEGNKWDEMKNIMMHIILIILPLSDTINLLLKLVVAIASSSSLLETVQIKMKW